MGTINSITLTEYVLWSMFTRNFYFGRLVHVHINNKNINILKERHFTLNYFSVTGDHTMTLVPPVVTGVVPLRGTYPREKTLPRDPRPHPVRTKRNGSMK